MLPPVVIQRGDMFLGPNGWTPLRREALSFDYEGQAVDWMTRLPMVMVEGGKVARVEAAAEDPGRPTHSSEYDPSEAA